jgi:hypothetical protein
MMFVSSGGLSCDDRNAGSVHAAQSNEPRFRRGGSPSIYELKQNYAGHPSDLNYEVFVQKTILMIPNPLNARCDVT